MEGLEGGLDDNAPPKLLAGAAVEAKKQAFLAVWEAGGEEDFVFPNNRRGMSVAGNGCLPSDVLSGGPTDG